MKEIELLAPARDLETALEAIRHGADAVYIGAERFGARSGAGNPPEDIRELCRRARVFRVRIYVTLNTILLEDELEDARKLAWQLYEAGADALIVQDMALLEMELPPIALHASTQMNNATAGQVRWLRSLGFRQVVLARELTLSEISEIHRQVPDVRLEVFVHGSVCVSYNGQCYASQHCFHRSANRGECAQFCRLPFDLVDAKGRAVERQKHLLSLRDMNRSRQLESLLDAGAVSLKIEGRLKTRAYVKNVVAYYRQALDRIFDRRPKDYRRSSLGRHRFTFEPRLEAVFNRGFTDYFLEGRKRGLANHLSPKSIGEPVGKVKNILNNCIVVEGTASFSNGDGLCYYSKEGSLQGFRVNRAAGDRLFPQETPPGLEPGTQLYRNYNQRLETLLSRPSAERKIPISWMFAETAGGFRLTASVEGENLSVSRDFPSEHTPARSAQKELTERRLARLGATVFESRGVDFLASRDWFVPVSLLSSWQGWLISALERLLGQGPTTEPPSPVEAAEAPFKGKEITYLGNVSNSLAKRFCLDNGALSVENAMEVSGKSIPDKPLLMRCRYCLLYELGCCAKQGERTLVQPLSLRLADGRVFPLVFDCRECKMEVYAS
ncbi:MAG: U32 family peptidase [Prevotellaceae bacterium]|nr:U32 family peptidase [Prevotellaceae bacterium]